MCLLYCVCSLFRQDIEGSRSEWCISSMLYSRDIPSWSGTLNMEVENMKIICDKPLNCGYLGMQCQWSQICKLNYTCRKPLCHYSLHNVNVFTFCYGKTISIWHLPSSVHYSSLFGKIVRDANLLSSSFNSRPASCVLGNKQDCSKLLSHSSNDHCLYTVLAMKDCGLYSLTEHQKASDPHMLDGVWCLIRNLTSWQVEDAFCGWPPLFFTIFKIRGMPPCTEPCLN